MNIVLVHGSWHGAWCWERVIPLLTQAGHQVIAPDLPGHGQDKTPIREVTLDTYVDYLSQLLRDLAEPAILLGHSMAGIVISQAAQRVPEKIAKLVYLAGFLPQSGESLLSIAKQQKPTKVTSPMRIASEESAVYFPPSHMQPFAYNQCESSVFAALEPLFCVEPFLPWTMPVNISAEHYGLVPRVYIECAQDQAIHLSSQQRMIAKSPCDVFQLNSDHSPFYSDPQGLVEILLQLT